MNDMDVTVRLKADGTGLAQQLTEVKGGLGGASSAARDLAGATGELSAASKAMAAANDDAVDALRKVAVAANENSSSLGKAAIGASQYSSMAAQIRAAIDPMYAAQQRFNQQMDAADVLLREGAILEHEYAAAVALARQELQAHAQAVAGNSSAMAAAASKEAADLRAAADQAARYAGMANQLRSALDPMFAAQQRFNQQLDAAEVLLREGAILEHEYAAAVDLARKELQDQAKAVAGSSNSVSASAASQANSVTSAHGRMSVSSQILMHSIRSANDSFAAGLPVTMIVTEQMGRLGEAAAYAAQESGKTTGVMAALGRVMGGPWSIAVMAAITILSSLASHFLESGEEAEKAKNKTYDFSVGLDVLALKGNAAADAMKQLEDATKSAIKVQGDFLAVMGQTANASVEALEKRIAETKERVKALSESWSSLSNLNPAVAIWKTVQISQLKDQIETDEQALVSAKAAAVNYDLAASQRKVTDQLDASAAATDRYNEAVGRLNARRKATLADPVGTAANGTFFSQEAYEAELKKEMQARDKAIEEARKKDRKTRTRTPVDRTAQTENFAQDTGNRIANIADQYANLPSAVEKANKSIRELDGIIGDITRKAGQKGVKLINAPELIAAAQAAKDAILANLNKPFEDYMQKQRESAEIDKLTAAGLDDQANALKVILDLKAKQRPLDDAQQAAILKSIENQRKYGLVLRDNRALLQANVQAVQDLRASLNETIANALKGRFSYSQVFASIGNSALNIISQRIVENMFGNALRSLEDEAGRNFAAAMDKGSTSVSSFADTVNAAIARIEGKPAPSSAASGGSANTPPSAADGNSGNDIVVVGGKPKASPIDLAGTSSFVLQAIGLVTHSFGTEQTKTLVNVLQPIFNKLEKSLPEALQGAFTGAAASQLILGSGGSSLGGGIGGAIGQEMGKKFLKSGLETISTKLGDFAGPIGSVLGGVVGGVLGGLFTPTKAGTTVLTNTSDKASVSASTSEVAAGLSTIGTSIQSSLDTIASKFNTSVGDFAVSIGQYKDYYRVSASGSDHIGDKRYPDNAGADVIYDGTDQAQAILIAIQNAIQDGAIKGLSTAVQKALGSSSDVEKAVTEALKVQEVELAIGGVGASMEKSFREEAQTAAERLRIAQQYGFDLVATEKTNAAERLALQKQLLQQQVGSIQDIIDSMTSGDLFEGSAVDQRAAILTKITAARTDVANNVDGASDTLAKLLEQLNTVSKEAYGSTAAYAADRQLIQDIARDTIASANQQIAAAAAAAASTSSSTSDATTAQLDEANDILTRIAAATGTTVSLLQSIATTGTTTNISALAALAATS